MPKYRKGWMEWKMQLGESGDTLEEAFKVKIK